MLRGDVSQKRNMCRLMSMLSRKAKHHSKRNYSILLLYVNACLVFPFCVINISTPGGYEFDSWGLKSGKLESIQNYREIRLSNYDT